MGAADPTGARCRLAPAPRSRHLIGRAPADANHRARAVVVAAVGAPECGPPRRVLACAHAAPAGRRAALLGADGARA